MQRICLHTLEQSGALGARVPLPAEQEEEMQQPERTLLLVLLLLLFPLPLRSPLLHVVPCSAATDRDRKGVAGIPEPPDPSGLGVATTTMG